MRGSVRCCAVIDAIRRRPMIESVAKHHTLCVSLIGAHPHLHGFAIRVGPEAVSLHAVTPPAAVSGRVRQMLDEIARWWRVSGREQTHRRHPGGTVIVSNEICD